MSTRAACVVLGGKSSATTPKEHCQRQQNHRRLHDPAGGSKGRPRATRATAKVRWPPWISRRAIAYVDGQCVNVRQLRACIPAWSRVGDFLRIAARRIGAGLPTGEFCGIHHLDGRAARQSASSLPPWHKGNRVASPDRLKILLGEPEPGYRISRQTDLAPGIVAAKQDLRHRDEISERRDRGPIG